MRTKAREITVDILDIIGGVLNTVTCPATAPDGACCTSAAPAFRDMRCRVTVKGGRSSVRANLVIRSNATSVPLVSVQAQ